MEAAHDVLGDFAGAATGLKNEVELGPRQVRELIVERNEVAIGDGQPGRRNIRLIHVGCIHEYIAITAKRGNAFELEFSLLAKLLSTELETKVFAVVAHAANLGCWHGL